MKKMVIFATYNTKDMTEKNETSKAISRRAFLRKMGAGSSLALLSLSGCDSAVKSGSGGGATGMERGEMTLRTTPTTGDKVSLLGYGCARWPRKEVNGEVVFDQEMVNRLIDTAIEGGVNYFDCAPPYCRGMCEKVTGIALSRHPREKYFIATKLSNLARQTWSLEESKKMYYNSFKDLQTDYIDYMLLHAIGMGDGMAEFNARFIDNGLLDFLMEEREAGRIRNLGFSYHGDVAVFDWALANHDKYHWDMVQIQMNYLDWRHAKELNERNTDAEYLYGELHKRGIPVVIMEPLLGGRLTKVPDHIFERLKQAEPERSVASWAFRFAGTPEGVLSVLSGMEYMEHLEDNLRTFSPLKPLTEEENRFLFDTADLMVKYPTVACNECQYCMPCPYGIDIPGIFSHYNKCVNHGDIAKGPDAENYSRARKTFLVGYDRKVEKLRQADHCIGCRRCVSHCPQTIDIPAELHKIDLYAESLKQSLS